MLRRLAWFAAATLCLVLCLSTALAENEVIHLPDSLTIIDDQAFYKDSEIREIVLPDGVAEIGSEAFAYSGLERINLPASITRIADDAFAGCADVVATFEGEDSYALRWWVENRAVPVEFVQAALISTDIGLNKELCWQVEATGNMRPFTYKYQLDRNELMIDEVSTDSEFYRWVPELPGNYRVAVNVIDAAGNETFYREGQQCTIVDERENISDGQFEFAIAADGTAVLTKCLLTTGELPPIPSEIEGHVVTAIDEWAFSDLSGLTGNLVIPDSVTSIGTCAFDGCTGLDGTLTLPAGIKEIGEYAFMRCGNLSGELVLPETVEVVGAGAFAYCQGFTGELRLPAGLTTICAASFNGCTGLTGNLVIPDGVTEIGEAAFVECTGLKQVYFPASVVFIGDAAFADCLGLTATFESEGSYAYAWWQENYEKPVASVTDLPESAHPYSSNTSETITWTSEKNVMWLRVHFAPETETEPGHDFIRIIDRHGYIESYSGTELADQTISVFGDSFSIELTSDDKNNFYGYRVDYIEEVLKQPVEIVGIFLSTTTATVGDQLDWEVLHNYDMPPWTCTFTLYVDDEVVAVVESDNEAFSYVTDRVGTYKLHAKIVDGEGNVDEAFSDLCVVTEAITDGFYRFNLNYNYPDDPNTMKIVGCMVNEGELPPIPSEFDGYPVTCIYFNAFRGQSGLTGNLLIPEGITDIRFSAFENCSGLTGDLVIPSSVKRIGDRSFAYCTGLTGKLTLGAGVERIEGEAFKGCTGLTEVYLPASIYYIGDDAFSECNNLTCTFESKDSYAYAWWQENMGVPEQKLPESSHPYAPNTDECVTWQGSSETLGFKVHFAPETSIDEWFDCVCILDANGEEISRYSGMELSDKTIVVMSNPFTIRLLSNYDYENYGYRVDSIEEFYELSPVTVESVELVTAPAIAGQNVTWRVHADGTGLPFTYEYTLSDDRGHSWHEKSESNTYILYYGNTDDVPAGTTLTLSVRVTDRQGNEVEAVAEPCTVVSPDEVELCTYRVLDDGTAEITGYRLDRGEIRPIPAEIDGYRVTRIGQGAFKGHSLLTGRLILPDTLTSIGERAFMDCNGLSGDLIIPDSVTEIGACAFYECDSLDGILKISSNVTAIEDYTFFGCWELTGPLVIPEGVTSIGESAFRFIGGFTGELKLPDSIVTIGESAFAVCYFDRVVLPSQLQSLGSRAFAECPKLTSVHFPASITSIAGNDVFEYCDRLSRATFDTLDCYAYRWWKARYGGVDTYMESTHPYPENAYETATWQGSAEALGFRVHFTPNTKTVPGEDYIYILDAGYKEIARYTGVELADQNISVMSNPFHIRLINNSGYDGCFGYRVDEIRELLPEPVTIDAVEFIGDETFVGADMTWRISTGGAFFPFTYTYTLYADGVAVDTLTTDADTYVGRAASDAVYTLNVRVTDSMGNVAEDVSMPCTAQTFDIDEFFDYEVMDDGNVEITGYKETQGDIRPIPAEINGRKVTRIGAFAFAWQERLTGPLYLPNTLIEIGENAFNGCVCLSGQLKLPEGLTTIGEDAFAYCSHFTGELAIPESVTDLAARAFYGFGYCCTLKLPGTLKEIKDETFGWASLSGQLVLPEGLQRIGREAFSGSSISGDLRIPESVTFIDTRAFAYCEALKGKLILPSTLTEIWDKAFYDCNFTGDLVIPEGVTRIGEMAFYQCNGFTGKLKLPSSVKVICAEAFAYCSGFYGELYTPSGLTSLDLSCINETAINCIYLPDSITELVGGKFGLTADFESNTSYAYRWWYEQFGSSTIYPESWHPYTVDSLVYSWYDGITIHGDSITVGFEIHFVPETDFQPDTYLTIWNENHEVIGNYTAEELADQTISITCNSFTIGMTGRYHWDMEDRYGYRIDSIQPIWTV